MKKTMRKKLAFDAARDGNLTAITDLVLTNADANWRLANPPWSLLDQAVRAGQHHIASFLLRRGADPNTRGKLTSRIPIFDLLVPLDFYLSPLATAIELQDCLTIKMLLDAGASLDLPRLKIQGRLETCGDFLDKHPHLAAQVEALSILGATSTPPANSVNRRAPRSL